MEDRISHALFYSTAVYLITYCWASCVAESLQTTHVQQWLISPGSNQCSRLLSESSLKLLFVQIKGNSACKETCTSYLHILFQRTHTHTHPFNSPLSGTTWLTSTSKVKPIWILLKQETVSGSGNCWAICKSAPRSSQKTMPVPHHSVFCRPDALPAAQPTVSKH